MRASSESVSARTSDLGYIDAEITLYGDNVLNEEYDITRLDLAFSGFTEIIRSNDRSEFGIKFAQRNR